jgi:hypothetical protein
VENSTITGNTSRFFGGGVNLIQGTVEFSNSTITGNSGLYGGGLYNRRSELILKRNVVSGNKAPKGPEIMKDIEYGNVITVSEYNVVGASSNSGVVGFSLSATNIVPTMPTANILLPLADNGGPTPTHALVDGSPAIDAVPGILPECSGVDQRGMGRPQGAGCDIGAFEK